MICSWKGASRSFTQGVTNCRTSRRHVVLHSRWIEHLRGTTCRIAPSPVLGRVMVGMGCVGRLASLRYSEKGARGSFSLCRLLLTVTPLPVVTTGTGGSRSLLGASIPAAILCCGSSATGSCAVASGVETVTSDMAVAWLLKIRYLFTSYFTNEPIRNC